MNDISLVQVIKPVVVDVVYKLLDPMINIAKKDLYLIDKKEAKRLTCQSESGWQQIASLPELKAIEHRKSSSFLGHIGRSIYYYPEDFDRVIRKVLREKVLD